MSRPVPGVVSLQKRKRRKQRKIEMDRRIETRNNLNKKAARGQLSDQDNYWLNRLSEWGRVNTSFLTPCQTSIYGCQVSRLGLCMERSISMRTKKYCPGELSVVECVCARTGISSDQADRIQCIDDNLNTTRTLRAGTLSHGPTLVAFLSTPPSNITCRHGRTTPGQARL